MLKLRLWRTGNFSAGAGGERVGRAKSSARPNLFMADTLIAMPSTARGQSGEYQVLFQHKSSTLNASSFTILQLVSSVSLGAAYSDIVLSHNHVWLEIDQLQATKFATQMFVTVTATYQMNGYSTQLRGFSFSTYSKTGDNDLIPNYWDKFIIEGLDYLHITLSISRGTLGNVIFSIYAID